MDIAFLSIQALTDKIKNKEITAPEVIEAFLAQIHKVNPSLNAFVSVLDDLALAEAKERQGGEGALLGVPIAVSDSINVRGAATSKGSLLMRDRVVSQDAPEVARLREQGAIIVGKGNVAEFGLSCVAENRLRGPARNPWNLEGYAAGTGGGAAAAVAAGLCSGAVAGDSFGSIRLAAHSCGVVGLKLTRGRLAYATPYMLPLTEQVLFQKGIFARRVEDVERLLRVMIEEESITADPKRSFSQVKIAWSPDLGFIEPSPDILAMCEAQLELLKKQGAQVEKVELPIHQEIIAHARNLIAADRYLPVVSFREDDPDFLNQVTDYTREWLAMGNTVTGVQYSMAYTYTQWLQRQFDKLFADYAFLLTPATLYPTLLVDDLPMLPLERQVDNLLMPCAYNLPFNLSGHPALALPVGLLDGDQPVALQMVGPYQGEQGLLELAYCLEREGSWGDRHPLSLPNMSNAH